MKILLSIKPEFVEKIIPREKFEFRKLLLKRKNSYRSCLFYNVISD